jgi:hypothetical protein
MAGEHQVLPGANVLDWSATKFNRQFDYSVSFEATWTHSEVDDKNKITTKTEPIPLDPVPLKTPDDYQFTPNPPKFGDVTGKVNVTLPANIRSGTVDFKLTFTGTPKVGTAKKTTTTFTAPTWTVLEDLVTLDVQKAPGETLPPREDKDKPVVFYGRPFNFLWSVKPAQELLGIELVGGNAPGRRAVGGAGPFAPNTLVKGVETLTLTGTEPKEFEFFLDLRIKMGDTQTTADPFPPKLVVQAKPLSWKDFPVRTSSTFRRSNAAPTFGYTPASKDVPAATGDTATLAKSINDKRASVPKRTYFLESSGSVNKDDIKAHGAGVGNVYLRDGNAKNPADPDPQARLSAKENLTPSHTFTDKADKDNFAFYVARLFKAEGDVTTVSALSVDGELTLGTGYATTGPSVGNILNEVFTRDPKLKATAFELGMSVEPNGKKTAKGDPLFDLWVADTTTPDQANPHAALLKAGDAKNYISCNADLMNFLANLGIGTQPDLSPGATAPADANAFAKAQRQVMLDAQWTEAQKVWFTGVPASYTDDAKFLVVHSHGAGNGFAGWQGDGAANNPVAVADAVWAKLKGNGGRFAIAHAICQAVASADAEIKRLDAAEKAAAPKDEPKPDP